MWTFYCDINTNSQQSYSDDQVQWILITKTWNPIRAFVSARVSESAESRWTMPPFIPIIINRLYLFRNDLLLPLLLLLDLRRLFCVCVVLLLWQNCYLRAVCKLTQRQASVNRETAEENIISLKKKFASVSFNIMFKYNSVAGIICSNFTLNSVPKLLVI